MRMAKLTKRLLGCQLCDCERVHLGLATDGPTAELSFLRLFCLSVRPPLHLSTKKKKDVVPKRFLKKRTEKAKLVSACYCKKKSNAGVLDPWQMCRVTCSYVATPESFCLQYHWVAEGHVHTSTLH